MEILYGVGQCDGYDIYLGGRYDIVPSNYVGEHYGVIVYLCAPDATNQAE